MAWYKSKGGWASVGTAAYFWLDHYGYIVSLHDIGVFGWRHSHLMTAILPWVFLILAVFFFERNRRKGFQHDVSTLTGRTKAFCDELRAFHKELGKEPKIDFKDSYSGGEFTEKNKELTLRGLKMHHGFHLRFMERAMNLWHEHGLEMRESPSLHAALMGRIDEDERLNSIVKQFSDLVKMSED